MKLPSSILALLSLTLLVNVVGSAGTTPATGKITAALPGKPGEDPTEIQTNIDRIQGEIKNLNVKVANLLSSLNETNAKPFNDINKWMVEIQEQQTKLDDIETKMNKLSGSADANDKTMDSLQRWVDCFKSSGCGPESF